MSRGARDLTAGDRALPFRLGPSLIAGFGLSLALAGVLATPEGPPVEGLARRVFLPLPDWLIITAGAAFSIASLLLVTIVWYWRSSSAPTRAATQRRLAPRA
jgi:hypothetical protein